MGWRFSSWWGSCIWTWQSVSQFLGKQDLQFNPSFVSFSNLYLFHFHIIFMNLLRCIRSLVKLIVWLVWVAWSGEAISQQVHLCQISSIFSLVYYLKVPCIRSNIIPLLSLSNVQSGSTYPFHLIIFLKNIFQNDHNLEFFPSQVNSKNCDTVATGIQFGLMGCLSTVSTFMAEYNAMRESNRPWRAYAYAIFTMAISFGLGVLIYNVPVWAKGYNK